MTSSQLACVGVDVGKSCFHVVGLNQNGAVALRGKHTRHGNGNQGVRSSCRVPDEYILHNRSALLIGREVLVGLLSDLSTPSIA